MPEAFVLFKTLPSHEREVYLALAEHTAIAEVHALYGEFDLLGTGQFGRRRRAHLHADAGIPTDCRRKGNTDADCGRILR